MGKKNEKWITSFTILTHPASKLTCQAIGRVKLSWPDDAI